MMRTQFYSSISNNCSLISDPQSFMWFEGFHDGPHDVVHRDVSPGLWRPRLLPSERFAQDLRPRGSRLHVRGREHSHVPAVWKVRTQSCACSVGGENTVMYLQCGR